MNRFFTILLTIVFLTAGLANAQAQKDSAPVGIDSVNASKLKVYEQRLAGIEQQRVIDSIQKADLENQIISLNNSDRARKNVLQKKLDSLQKLVNGRFEQKKIQIDSMRKNVKGLPVIAFFGDTLFRIYSRHGSFSAEERAAAVQKRILALGDNFNYSADSLLVSPAELTSDITYGEQVITTITETDALLMNSTQDSLAANYRNKINNAVKRYQKETSLFTLGKEISVALLIIGLISVLIIVINRAFRWLNKHIQTQEGRKLTGFHIGSYMILDPLRQIHVLLSLLTIVRWFVIIISIYLSLPVLFGLFPWTKDFAEKLIGYFLDPLRHIAGALWNYLPNLVTIAIIVLVFHYVLKVFRFLRYEIATKRLIIPGFYADWANPTYQIIRVLVYAFLLVVIFPYLPGSDSPVFKGVTVFLGFLFTFGSAGSLSNIVAGLTLTYMRLFVIGDRVKIGDVVGDVIEKSLLVTRIRTIKNEIISIPNSTIMNSHTINYSRESGKKGLIIHTTVTIGYDVPWRVMHEVLIEAALKTENLLPEPSPFVLQTSLDDFYVSYQINAYTREPGKQALIYSHLHANIQDLCNEKGIEIMSPHYRAARDGSQTTIPTDYLPKDYQAPEFRVTMKTK